MSIDRRRLLGSAAGLAVLTPMLMFARTLAAAALKLEAANAEAHDAHERLSTVEGLRGSINAMKDRATRLFMAERGAARAIAEPLTSGNSIVHPNLRQC
jgi:hypothetical protein